MSSATVTARPARSPAEGSIHLGRLAGLDGLRAIAVIAVLLYHQGGLLPGGFLGVDVFFVISGFLISALLLAEWEGSGGRIDVPRFWLRRARRLLPALFLLLGVVLLFALVVASGEIARLRAEVVAAFFYVTNWFLIFGHQSYFEAVGRPSPFRHLWSLAVEEQFYLVWPLALAALLPLLRRRLTLAVVVTVAVASAVWMAVLFVPYTDPSRVYYGTDTRLFGLLAGAALAFVWRPARPRPVGKAWMTLAGIERRRPRGSYLPDVAGVALLAVVFGFFVLFDDYSPFLYLGGFCLLALATAALIACVVHPDSRLGSVILDSPPLRWAGERSYSIYLWHWPVYMFTRPQLDVPLAGPADVALRLALTLVLAELSYRFVETPIRRGALGRLWHAWRDAPRPRRRAITAWLAPSASAVLILAIVVAARVAGATPGPVPSYLAAGAIDQVVSHTDPPAARSTPTPRPGADEPNAGARASHRAPPPPRGTRLPPPPASTARAPLKLGRVFALGDSVMLGAATQLGGVIDNVEVSAAIGRMWPQGIDIVRRKAATGKLPQIVVVHLGNNEPLFDRDFDAMMQALAPARLVVFVNLRVPRDWESRDNDVIASGVARYPKDVLVDWHAASDGHPEFFWEDGMHLRPEGAKVYAGLVADAIAQRTGSGG